MKKYLSRRKTTKRKSKMKMKREKNPNSLATRVMRRLRLMKLHNKKTQLMILAKVKS